MTDKEKLTASEDHVILLKSEISDLKEEVFGLKVELQVVNAELRLLRKDQLLVLDRLEDIQRRSTRGSVRR